MANSKITLFGFYGRKNSGDDAMLYGIVKYLSVKTGATLVIPTDIKPVLPATQNEIIFITRRIRTIVKAVQTSNHLVIGGGSLFHTKGKRLKFKKMITRILMLAMWARLYKCKVSFISAGIGPFDDVYRRLVNRIMLKFCNYINVRDIKSYDIIVNAGYPKNKCSLTDDFVYAIDLPEDLLQQPVKNVIAVNLLPYYTEYAVPGNNTIIVETFAKVIQTLLQHNCADSIELICINDEITSKSADTPILEALLQAVKDQRVKMVPYSKDPLLLIKKIKASKLIITLRYHGIVYANIAGVPCIAINHHIKTDMLVQKLNKKEVIAVDVALMKDAAALTKIITQHLCMQHYIPNHDSYDLIMNHSFPENYFE